MTTSSPMARRLAEKLSRDVAELSDRTSPDDQPDMMLVTEKELTALAAALIDAEMAGVLEALEKIRQIVGKYSRWDHDSIEIKGIVAPTPARKDAR